MTGGGVEDRLELQVGAEFEVSMQWQLGGANSAFARATFVVEVEAIENVRDRLLCRLVEIVQLRTSHPPESLDQTMLARIKALVGKYAYLPMEVTRGISLHLKVTTLTGLLEHG
jgi:hypothetical protein